jgi:hypothetical protein
VMPFVALTNLEEIAITITLPQAVANVPSLWHALKIRHCAQAHQTVTSRVHENHDRTDSRSRHENEE